MAEVGRDFWIPLPSGPWGTSRFWSSPKLKLWGDDLPPLGRTQEVHLGACVSLTVAAGGHCACFSRLLHPCVPRWEESGLPCALSAHTTTVKWGLVAPGSSLSLASPGRLNCLSQSNLLHHCRTRHQWCCLLQKMTRIISANVMFKWFVCSRISRNFGGNSTPCGFVSSTTASCAQTGSSS